MTIRGLIEAVERGDMPNFCPMFHAQGLCTECEGAFHSSLDAAKALHDALLPGWRLCGAHQKYKSLRWSVSIDRFDDPSKLITAMDSASFARAWLLAILRALEGDA
jgi:hypothetical protein